MSPSPSSCDGWPWSLGGVVPSLLEGHSLPSLFRGRWLRYVMSVVALFLYLYSKSFIQKFATPCKVPFWCLKASSKTFWHEVNFRSLSYNLEVLSHWVLMKSGLLYMTLMTFIWLSLVLLRVCTLFMKTFTGVVHVTVATLTGSIVRKFQTLAVTCSWMILPHFKIQCTCTLKVIRLYIHVHALVLWPGCCGDTNTPVTTCPSPAYNSSTKSHSEEQTLHHGAAPLWCSLGVRYQGEGFCSLSKGMARTITLFLCSDFYFVQVLVLKYYGRLKVHILYAKSLLLCT